MDLNHGGLGFRLWPGHQSNSRRSWPIHGTPNIHLIEAQKDGKVVVTGDFYFFEGLEETKILRLNADGSFDDSFKPPPLPSGPYGGGINALLALPDDKLLVGLASSNGIVRLNPNGTLDPGFQIDPLQNHGSYDYASVSGIIRQADGKLIAYGWFNQVGTNVAGGIARLNPDGSFDSTFEPHLTYQGTTAQGVMALNQLGGKIIVAGGFDAVGGLPYNGLARLHSDGLVDPTFTKIAGYYNGVFDVQSDGRLIVKGPLG